MQNMSLVITNTTKEKLPNHPFKKMAERVLGKKYDLSLTIIDRAEIKLLNFRYRSKNSPTDILSFPINKNTGEIFLCLSEAKKEAVKFNRTFDNFVAFLFIHGLMHLKGFDHSSTMESNEQKFRKEFRI
jgi:probable rRNA maturation factor